MHTHTNRTIKRVIVLGSTGSVGVQTLEVIAHLNALHAQDPISSPTHYQVVGLGAGKDLNALAKQAKAFDVRDVSLCELSPDADQCGLNIRAGVDAARRLVEEIPCDLVVGAIVGIAGLDSLLRAVELGIDVALANKETLVAAGSLVIDAAKKSNARLLPLDSEHAGVWQCLQSQTSEQYCPPMPAPPSVKRIVLTASGGPFLQQSREQIQDATLADATNHPNWSMGDKVSIDSATLMNKGLELIEAHWLFGIDADQLGAIVHPQSIVHAMIETHDASAIAQLGAADMKSPIHHALCFPDRSPSCADALDVTKMGSLDFIEVDHDRFPAINLALGAIRSGGTAGAILNAANEQAVSAFVDGRLPFGRIDRCVAQAIAAIPASPINTLDDVYAADAQARAFVDEQCTASAGRTS